jgi:hypothetical protein
LLVIGALIVVPASAAESIRWPSATSEEAEDIASPETDGEDSEDGVGVTVLSPPAPPPPILSPPETLPPPTDAAGAAAVGVGVIADAFCPFAASIIL